MIVSIGTCVGDGLLSGVQPGTWTFNMSIGVVVVIHGDQRKNSDEKRLEILFGFRIRRIVVTDEDALPLL